MAPQPTGGIQEGARTFKFAKPPVYDTLEEERQGRKERLAQAFRVFGKLGLSLGVAGHLTYRDPILTDHFWVNPFGKEFSHMEASDLLLINPEGKVVGGGIDRNPAYNEAAFTIHHAIHTARPDIDAACHSHSPNGVAFSTLGENITMTTQDSCVFHKQCALYENFGGVVLADEEGKNIANTLGTHNKAAILQNHGILTVGTTIESATSWFILLERHCEIELKSRAAAAANGKKPKVIGDAEAEFTSKQTGSEAAGYFQVQPYFQLVEAESSGAFRK